MISVVIPAINEASGIGDVVTRCLRFAHEVIVVDGGSSDGTALIASVAGAKVIHQPKRGYGLALLTGFKAATGTVIATADGDGTYPVEMIPAMNDILCGEGLFFISGCRFPLSNPESMSLRNQIGNRLLSALGSVLFLHRYRDILSGMWVFKRSCLLWMKLHSKKWDLSQEIKIESNRLLGFREIQIDYHERKGVSKLYPWRVGMENLIYFFVHRFGLRRLFGKPFNFNE